MEEEYADIYYVDTRNATRDHRTQAPSRTVNSWLRPRVPAPVPTRTVYLPQQPAYQQPQPMMLPQTAGAAALFGRLTTGQIVEMIAQGFAAMQSLPGAPVTTRDVETDIGNMVLYQAALAGHAKRDEQWRTLGSLVAKLVG
ncbi:hypothetical protein BH11MYX2_BH11MYX2_36850 [soil metagenome]